MVMETVEYYGWKQGEANKSYKCMALLCHLKNIAHSLYAPVEATCELFEIVRTAHNITPKSKRIRSKDRPL